MSNLSLLTITTIAFAAASAAIIGWYLVTRPTLVRGTVVWLFLGLGVFPIAAAVGGNYQGFETTKNVDFCSGCHVMEPWVADVRDPESTSLAAMHGRNDAHGKEACYACHADYGMYGTVATKANGTVHLIEYFREYRGMETSDALAKIALYQPYRNATCMHCHSTQLPGWNDEPEHAAIADDLRSGAISCASEGCHGPAHGVVKTPAGDETSSSTEGGPT